MSQNPERLPVTRGPTLPIARMRAVYRSEDVEKRLDKLPQKEHESLRSTYERMLEKGPERFQVKPSGLPVMDSLQAALADTSGDTAKQREGVELTLKQLNAAFEKGRVTELNPVGEKFDPHRHQAISMVPADQEANTVVAVLQRGYTLADRVLRPALVTVSAPK